MESDPNWKVTETAAREALLICACAGDMKSLEGLLVCSEPSLRQTLSDSIPATFRSAFGVDDIIQVTFIEAFLRIGQFTPRGPDSFIAWLIILARRNLTDALRELRRQKRIPRNKLMTVGAGSDSYEGLLGNLMGTTTTPSRGAGRLEIKAMIEDALGKLPPDYEKVVRMMDFDGKTAPEVAIEMRRSNGAVYMLQARAHDRLRLLLGSSSNFFSTGS